MRPSPTYYAWKIEGASPEEAQVIQHWLADRFDLDRVWTGTLTTMPNGVEWVQTVPHRFGDYFAAIEMQPDSGDDLASFRLVFRRFPNAARYWKDLMVKILREIQTTHPNASIHLESKGELEPISV